MGTRILGIFAAKSRQFFIVFSLAILFVCGAAAHGAETQENIACETVAANAHFPSKGIPFDWSHRHVIATGDRATGPVGQREHRLLYAYLKRTQENCTRKIPPSNSKASPQIDWDVPLGAAMAGGTYPAKYNFDLPGETPTCTDFAVYGLNVAGVTGGQPNLVGLTNLYSGTADGNGLCNGNTGVYRDIYGKQVYAATVKFAFNGSTLSPAGAITNSVVMSEDGTKVAYVESNGTASALHVVSTTPGASGPGAIESFNQYGNTIAAAAVAPGSISTVPSSGAWAAADSYSSVWVDYQNDIAYVGTDDGSLHRIENVFCTTASCIESPVAPTEITTGGWPVALTGAGPLTSPVEDANSVLYMAGATSGLLYAVTSTGAVTSSNQSFMPNSIMDGATLDIDENGITQALYWFSNSQSAASKPTVRQPQLVQTNSALTSINNYSLLLNGTQAWGGAALTVHSGTFDNAFYNNRDGNMWACGWYQDSIYPGSLPNNLSLIRFGINGTTVTPDTSDAYVQLSPEYVNPATSKTCSPLTEVLDSAGADHLFASSYFGTALGTCISGASCIAGFTIGSTGSPATYTLDLTGSFALNTVDYLYNDYTSGIIVDNTVDPTSSTCGPGGNQTCAQAASIYFTYGNDALKLTQAQLQ
jgi:hypothetical protein